LGDVQAKGNIIQQGIFAFKSIRRPRESASVSLGDEILAFGVGALLAGGVQNRPLIGQAGVLPHQCVKTSASHSANAGSVCANQLASTLCDTSFYGYCKTPTVTLEWPVTILLTLCGLPPG
jgi:hypothetical protein